MVYARDHHVNLSVAEHVVEGYLDTVGRHSGECIYLDAVVAAHLFEKEFLGEGYGLASAALGCARGYGYHVAQRLRHLHGGSKACRGVSVIVGYEYQFSAIHSGRIVSL